MFGLIICSIFNWVICLYNCWVVNVLFIFWIQVPYQIYNLQIFPLRLWTFHSFIYLFIFGCPGSSSLCGLFSGFSELGLPSSCGVQASHCCGFSCCGAWALGCVGFNSCSSWALEDKLYSCGTHRSGFFFKTGICKEHFRCIAKFSGRYRQFPYTAACTKVQRPLLWASFTRVVCYYTG